MIDINDADIVITRRTADGRFVIFTSTDVQPGWPLRWWTAVADTGGDGFGIPVRFDGAAAPAGWTARRLLAVARARMIAENDRQSRAITVAAIASLDLAAAGGWDRADAVARDDPVAFSLSEEASPYHWTVARCGQFHLPLCPESREPGRGRHAGAVADHPRSVAARRVSRLPACPSAMDVPASRRRGAEGRGAARRGHTRRRKVHDSL